MMWNGGKYVLRGAMDVVIGATESRTEKELRWKEDHKGQRAGKQAKGSKARSNDSTVAQAERGGKDEQYNLGKLYEYGGGGVEKDPVQALYWFEKAAKQGHQGARHKVGVVKGNIAATEREDPPASDKEGEVEEHPFHHPLPRQNTETMIQQACAASAKEHPLPRQNTETMIQQACAASAKEHAGCILPRQNTEAQILQDIMKMEGIVTEEEDDNSEQDANPVVARPRCDSDTKKKHAGGKISLTHRIGNKIVKTADAKLHNAFTHAATKIQARARGCTSRKNPLRAAYGMVVDFEVYCHINSHEKKKGHFKPHLEHELSVRI
jgi:hypothetical protein